MYGFPLEKLLEMILIESQRFKLQSIANIPENMFKQYEQIMKQHAYKDPFRLFLYGHENLRCN